MLRRKIEEHNNVYTIPCPLDPNLIYSHAYQDYIAAAAGAQPMVPPPVPPPAPFRSVDSDPWRGSLQLVSSLTDGDEAAVTCCQEQHHAAIAGYHRSIAPRTKEPLSKISVGIIGCEEEKKRRQVMWCSGGIQARWFIDAFCVITAGALLLVVELGWIPSIQTGFYCGDPSIAYRYTGDTIKISVLLFVCTFAPLFTIWSVEAGCCFCQGSVEVTGVRARLRRGLSHAWVWYREYLLGLVLVLLMVDIAKVLVGEPRPHFLDTCKPDVALTPEGCKAVASPTGYVEDFKCTNTDLSNYIVRDSTKSFPSGHAALSVYSAIFLVWFLQRRMPRIPNKSPSIYLRPWLQCVCLSWAMACSFTRITDHRHHPHDVLAGSVIGVVMAYLAIRNYCGGFWPGYCATSLHEVSVSSSGERGGTRTVGTGGPSEERTRENGHANTGVNGRNNHQSMRRLLSSTSSYSGSIAPDENLREVTQA